MRKTLLALAAFSSLALFPGCASGPAVKKQGYAALNNQRSFEYEFPVVWNGIERALSGYKIVSRDPDEVDELELRKLTEREIETDWMLGQSRDKYHEYVVNGSPRKKYLQTRFRFRVTAERRMGSTQVTVSQDEEIERLKSNGTSDGFEEAETVDTSRANEVLDRIQMSILKAP